MGAGSRRSPSGHMFTVTFDPFLRFFRLQESPTRRRKTPPVVDNGLTAENRGKEVRDATLRKPLLLKDLSGAPGRF